MKKELKPVVKTFKKFQKGRGVGSTLGKTCGRGDNGHRSRTGYKMLMSFEGGQMPLMRRLPKFGFTNIMHKRKIKVLTLREISSFYNDGEKVTIETLKEKKILFKGMNLVKIILKGSLKKKLEFSSDILFSEGARKHIIENKGIIS